MGPESNLLVSAYRAGRLLNELSFHAQHAWFFHFGHYEATRRVGRDLARKARELAPVASRDELQGGLSRLITDLLETVISQGRCEDLIEDEKSLGFIYDPADFIPLRAARLALVFEALGDLRRMVTTSLSDKARLAFRLGELVDEGVRPPDAYRYMEESAASARSDSSDSPQPEPDRGQHLDVVQEPDHTLRGAPVQPGEVTPAEDWAEEIRQLLRELGTLGALSARVLEAAEKGAAGNVEEVVEQLDRDLSTSLAGTRVGDVAPPSQVPVPGDEAGNIPDPPGSSTGRMIPVNAASNPTGGVPEARVPDPTDPEKVGPRERLTFERSTHTVVLDGTRFEHLDPRAFRLFKGIADATANDQWATAKTLGKDHLGRFLREHLSPQLYGVISSRGSRGGGYRLILPPRKP